MRSLTMISMTLVAALMCAGNPANAATKTFLVGSFEDLVVEGDINVVLDNRKAPSAKATGDRTTLDALKFEQNGLQLRIHVQDYQGKAQTVRSTEPLVIALNGRDVVRLTANGAASIQVNQVRAVNALASLRVAGPGSITINQLDSDRVNMLLTGSGAMTVAGGKARAGLITNDGTGSIAAEKLLFQQAKLTQKGNASTHVAVSDEIEITNRGAGAITVDGKATCFIRLPGSAKISCGKTALK